MASARCPSSGFCGLAAPGDDRQARRTIFAHAEGSIAWFTRIDSRPALRTQWAKASFPSGNTWPVKQHRALAFHLDDFFHGRLRFFGTSHADRIDRSPCDRRGDWSRERRVPTLLLVEDDRSLGIALESLFSSEGYDVQCAEDGLFALARVSECKPDVVVTDA